jgi:hypothetical protein
MKIFKFRSRCCLRLERVLYESIIILENRVLSTTTDRLQGEVFQYIYLTYAGQLLSTIEALEV